MTYFIFGWSAPLSFVLHTILFSRKTCLARLPGWSGGVGNGALESKCEGRTEDPSAEERTGRKPVAYSAAASVNIWGIYEALGESREMTPDSSGRAGEFGELSDPIKVKVEGIKQAQPLSAVVTWMIESLHV